MLLDNENIAAKLFYVSIGVSISTGRVSSNDCDAIEFEFMNRSVVFDKIASGAKLSRKEGVIEWNDPNSTHEMTKSKP